ncbi:hypothetical protein [Devosia ginsengisoli]|uniref:hypothetical protein n=1 Tax=Devosia ginsengisoli TaxID=400770 RepID=UPI0026EB2CB3|nr:hypothetical protein [Devosia ginsengisoli]MCR6673791.1 hypothetical protein [Devosia ginsengisoli]
MAAISLRRASNWLSEILAGRGQRDAGAFRRIVQRAIDLDHRRLQAAVHGVELDGHRFIELTGQRVEQHFGFARAGRNVLGNALADHVETAGHFMAAFAQLLEQGGAAIGQQVRQGPGAFVERIGQLGRTAFQQAGDGLRAFLERAGQRGGALFDLLRARVDGAGDRYRMGIERVGQRRDAAFDACIELGRAFVERAGHGAGLILEGQRQPAGAIVQRGDEVGGAIVHQRHEILGALAEAVGQRIAGRFERAGQVAAAFHDRAGDALADHVEVEHQAGMALGNGFAHALGIGEHAFALAGQFGDQRAHARFIVRIGAFERGDLVVDHHFELAGAAQRAFQPVAQRIDFAAHGLAHRSDLVGGGDFGLGQANGGLGDGRGSVAQVLRAAEQGGDGKEAEHRQHHDGEQADKVDRADEAAEIGHLRAIAQPGDDAGHGQPHDGQHQRDPGRGGRGAVLQVVEDFRGREAIVIGHAAGLLGDLVGGAQAFRTRAVRRLLFRLLGCAVEAEHRFLEGVFDGRKGQCGGIVLGGRILRHTLYNSRVGFTATRRTMGVVMTLHPFPVASSNGSNSMQMPRIVPQPSPPRAGSKPSNTFNLNQTERFLTQRLIFWG